MQQSRFSEFRSENPIEEDPVNEGSKGDTQELHQYDEELRNMNLSGT
jgi:hypothetical protein